jgi:hypothetical protein
MRRGQAPSLLVQTVLRVLFDALRFSMLGLKSRTQLAAENLFLRKQLACYLERQVKPRCADPATRVALVVLSRLIDLRQALVMVRPETLYLAPASRIST